MIVVRKYGKYTTDCYVGLGPPLNHEAERATLHVQISFFSEDNRVSVITLWNA